MLMTDSYPTNLPSFPSDRRSLIVQEIYTTERTFVRGLEIIVLVRCFCRKDFLLTFLFNLLILFNLNITSITDEHFRGGFPLAILFLEKYLRKDCLLTFLCNVLMFFNSNDTLITRMNLYVA